jgi:hypothetical protein
VQYKVPFSRHTGFKAGRKQSSFDYNVHALSNDKRSNTDGFVLAHAVFYDGKAYMRHGYSGAAVTGVLSLPYTKDLMTYNPFLSPFNRHRYFDYNEVWAGGSSQKPYRQEANLIVENCAPWEIDFQKKIKTKLGWGLVKSAKYSLTKSTLQLTLLHKEIEI